MNREDWLHAMADKLQPSFLDLNHPYPSKLSISCGFPSRGGLANKKRTIGQCWLNASPDGTIHVFISPTLIEPVTVSHVLVHELCHAVLPIEAKHTKTFSSLAYKLGLEGKPTATTAGAELTAQLQQFITQVGDYPHAELAAIDPSKKQNTRMLKVACDQQGCGYTCRLVKKWLDLGAPLCPIHELPMLAEGQERDADDND